MDDYVLFYLLVLTVCSSESPEQKHGGLAESDDLGL